MAKIALVADNAVIEIAEKNKTIVANVDNATHKALKILAITNDKTMSAILEEAIAVYIRSQK